MSPLARLAWRHLWRRPWRTLLTASAVALGLALLLVMLGLGDGSHLQMIDSAVRMGSGHVLVQAPGYQRGRAVDLAVGAPAAERVTAWARERAGPVRAVLPRAFASGLLSSADGATGVSLTGIAPDAEAAVSRFAVRITAGRFLAGSDLNAAVVGSGVARLLKVGVGSRVVAMAQGAARTEVGSILLRVVGVLHTGLEEVDEGLVLLPLSTLGEFLGLDGGVHQVALVLDDQARSGTVAADGRRAFPELEVLTWAQAEPQLEAAIKIDDGGHYLFNAIFFVIIAFVVLNTLSMSILERRREFALLGALGLGPGRLVTLVVLEGAMIALLAVAGGLLLGLSAHTYFRLHGLPLVWFTSESFEMGGVVLESTLYSFLSRARVLGSAAVVLGLSLALTLLVARHAGRAVDPNLLKGR